MVEPMDLFLADGDDARGGSSFRDVQSLRRSIIRLTLALYAMAGLMVISAFIWLAAVFGAYSDVHPNLVWFAGLSTLTLISGALWIEQRYRRTTAALAKQIWPRPRRA